MAEWISVMDRLPNDGTKVLAYFYYGSMECCWYDSTYYQPSWDRVTHWMPMSEPPKEKEWKNTK